MKTKNIKNLSYEFIDPEDALSSKDFHVVESFIKEAHPSDVGWHYIVDLIWIYSRIKNWPSHFQILDVGGGTGILQFLLAEMGFNVTNIDFNLFVPPKAFQKRYSTEYHHLLSYKKTSYKDFLDKLQYKNGLLRILIKKVKQKLDFRGWIHMNRYASRHESWRQQNGFTSNTGKISWLGGNICHVPEIQNNSFDAVVSLSALEHVPFDRLPMAIAEIKRIIKPDAHWAVTTSGSVTSETWFHNPSQGYCFSAFDLQKIFGAFSNTKPDCDSLLKKYQNCSYLKNNLAKFYYKSGNNGMPWGKWDPKYIPVGIFCK